MLVQRQWVWLNTEDFFAVFLENVFLEKKLRLRSLNIFGCWTFCLVKSFRVSVLARASTKVLEYE